MSAAAGFLVCVAWAGGLYAQDPQEYESGAFYVRLKPSSAPALAKGEAYVRADAVSFLQAAMPVYGLHSRFASMRTGNNERLGRTFRIEFDSLDRTEELLDWLESRPEVEMVEPVPAYYIQAGVLPGGKTDSAGDGASGTDPFYGTVNGVDLSWHLDLINAQEAWGKATAQSNVTVAIVDNAVWGDHPDLGIAAGNQYNVMSATAGNSAPPVSVDQDQECESLNSCNVYNWSHGTHCAGAVGAVRGNGVGIASIGSGVSLMGVSCPSTDASGLSVRNGFAGVTWAAEHGADVISLSWGGYSVAETEREVIQSCIDQGIVIVAAAGNDNRADVPFYPADLPGVISVASVNSDLGISSFSNSGDWVDVAAPGGFVVVNGNETSNCILSTTFCRSQSYRMSGITVVNGEFYDGMYGTSMATPVVAGLCGLLLSVDSTLDSYSMREVLMSSAQALDASSGKHIRPGSGAIDASAAVDLLQGGFLAPRNFTAVRDGIAVSLSWQAPALDAPADVYQLFRDDVLIAETQDSSFVDTVMDEGLCNYSVRALYGGREDTTNRAAVDVYVPDLYEVAVSVSPEGCGTVSGSGYYPAGEEILLTATAVPGCEFVRWVEDRNVLGRDTSLSYLVEYDAEIEAIFSGTPETHVESDGFAGQVAAYPNPFRNTIHLESAVTLQVVEVYSMSGQRLRELALDGAFSVEVDLSALPAGLYVLKVETGAGTETLRVSKY